MTEVCSKHLARSQFALQLQPPRLDVQPVQVLAPVVQLAQAQARVQVEQLVLVLEPAQQVRAQVVQLVPEPAQPVRAQQPHSPHQQLQSQCQPELCLLH